MANRKLQILIQDVQCAVDQMIPAPPLTTGQAGVSRDITAISVGGTVLSQFNHNPLVLPYKVVVSCPGNIVMLYIVVFS